MRVRIYFKGLAKGTWVFDFVSQKAFEEYLANNKNIKDYELLK